MIDAIGVNCPWKSHQEPPAHIGCTGAQGGNSTSQRTAAQDVVGEGFGFPVEVEAYAEECHQVEAKGYKGGCTHNEIAMMGARAIA